MPDGTKFKSYSSGEDIRDGIYDGLDEQLYRDAPYWNYSVAKLFLDDGFTSLHRAKGTGGRGINPSVAVVGQYAHALALEPHRLTGENGLPLFEVFTSIFLIDKSFFLSNLISLSEISFFPSL